MRSKSKANRFETKVKPYFYPSKECYMPYSPDHILSIDTEISTLGVDYVKENFGFELLCDNFKKSARELYHFYKKEYQIDIGYKGSLIPTDYLNAFIVHPISSKFGLGVSSSHAIKIGSYVGEYVGERISGHNSVFDTTYIFLNHDGSSTDAKDYGNIARFISHCPSEHSNNQILTSNLIAITNPFKSSEKLFFKASRDIKEFEPLCWDYGEKYSFSKDTEFLDKDTYLPIGESNTDDYKDFSHIDSSEMNTDPLNTHQDINLPMDYDLIM